MALLAAPAAPSMRPDLIAHRDPLDWDRAWWLAYPKADFQSSQDHMASSSIPAASAKETPLARLVWLPLEALVDQEDRRRNMVDEAAFLKDLPSQASRIRELQGTEMASRARRSSVPCRSRAATLQGSADHRSRAKRPLDLQADPAHADRHSKRRCRTDLLAISRTHRVPAPTLA